MEIYVYFQEVENRIRELRFASEKGEWYEDSPNGINHLKGLSGTSIACAADSAPNNANRWMYSQSTSREVQGCIYEANGKKWTYDNPNKLYYFTQNFDRKVRLEFCADRWFLRIYAHDGSKALEKVCQREGCKWKDQITLPMGTGAAKIKQNFIVLRWPQDVDNTTSEVHLFSTDGGILHDYLIGPSTGGEFSLV
ncbi:hypothetical protein L211DRAFT_465341 [Terfezia boudieri ATCC MYA-4762]|uniref:Uncharacterized protein n=1 Tax=Terfezia boudieri ATCC MYA-4762 TaxID=1051890 RepID=A0A3N4LYD3_9PEZI|nr:hypothetical protein L211DRAFT_465341 [Terfezia boudieri ATCC MYA-4762]